MANKGILGFLLGISLICIIQQCSALTCMECVDLPRPSVCGNVAKCPSNSSCLIRQYVTSSGVTLYSSRCASYQKCQGLSHRRDTPAVDDDGEDSVYDLETCDECCDTDYCNIEGCGTKVTSTQQRGPYCYQCNVEDETSGCRMTRLCDIGYACSISKSTFPGMYKTGCMPITHCNQTSDSPVLALMGRRRDSGLSIPLPHCCQDDFCNDINKLIASPSMTVDGGWSNWGAWSTCSPTCGSGQQTRSRSCVNPAPQNGGADCPGNEKESRACATICAVDGAWSEWGGWSDCSVTCGPGGLMTRNRSCDNPTPQHGGATCQGIDHVSKTCTVTVASCAVDGGWSEWGNWSACSVTCGPGGVMTRNRSCDNPAPQDGGATCQGEIHENTTCTHSGPSCAEIKCTENHYHVVNVKGTTRKLCLKLSWAVKSWPDANSACSNTAKGHLVSIHSLNELATIRDYLHGKISHEANCMAHNYTVVPVNETTQLCLKLWNQTKTWSIALHACQSVGGGDLVKIDSAEKNAAVGTYLHGHGYGHYAWENNDGWLWIGLQGVGEVHHHDSPKSLHYTWTDNTDAHYNLVSNTDGEHGKGRRRKTEYRCVLGYWGHVPEWWAEHCEFYHRYLCEIPM